MTPEQMIKKTKEAETRLIRFLYCDNGGIIRGKLTHIDGLIHRLEGGIGLTVAMQAFTMLDKLEPFEGMGPIGEVRIMPDPNTFKFLPYAPHAAAMTSDLLTLDGKAWDACPRNFLKRMIARAAECGIVIQSSFENEFILCREKDDIIVPADEALIFSTTGMHESAAVIDNMIDVFDQMGMRVDLYYPEYGPGQHELTIRHAEALTAADNQIFYRDAVRGVAHNHGLLASLAPKPFPDLPGNGCHIHCSLWDPSGETNLMWSETDRYHVSDVGYHFIAGIRTHLQGLIALTAPSYNSYRRIAPHMWSGAFNAWGPDNREAAIRIASPFRGQEAASINFELKSSDPSNNPYLALGGIIAAGIDGVINKLDPGAPILTDPGNLSNADLKSNGIDHLPGSLAQAADNLEKDDFLMDALGPMLAQSYLTVKRAEYRDFAAKNLDFEIRHHIKSF